MLPFLECALKAVKSKSITTLEILQHTTTITTADLKSPKQLPVIFCDIKNISRINTLNVCCKNNNFSNSKRQNRKAISIFQSINALRYPAILTLNKSSCIGNRLIHIDQTGWAGINSVPPIPVNELISTNEYEVVAEETLESLTAYLDEVVEKSNLQDTDVTYSSGVLSIKLGKHGTYVINKQTPNKQIWLSSPTSGPKRYDFVNKTWIYKHDGQSMYKLLNSEIPQLVNVPGVDFEGNCSFGKVSGK